MQVWTAITQKVAEALTELEKQTVPNWDQTKGHATRKATETPPLDGLDNVQTRESVWSLMLTVDFWRGLPAACVMLKCWSLDQNLMIEW